MVLLAKSFCLRKQINVHKSELAEPLVKSSVSHRTAKRTSTFVAVSKGSLEVGIKGKT